MLGSKFYCSLLFSPAPKQLCDGIKSQRNLKKFASWTVPVVPHPLTQALCELVCLADWQSFSLNTKAQQFSWNSLFVELSPGCAQKALAKNWWRLLLLHLEELNTENEQKCPEIKSPSLCVEASL